MKKKLNNLKIYHKSVLVKETLEYLNIQPNKTYLDATFGGGGHTRAILEQEPTCKVIAIDWDKKAIEKNAPTLEKKFNNRFKILWGNFAHIYKLFKKSKIKSVDGILADFGTSQYQISSKPGLSFQKNTPLDMRMSQSHYYFKASDVLNRFSEKDIAKILFTLGEEKYAKKIAQAIINYRKTTPFKTTNQLTNLIESLIPKWIQSKKRYKIHPATKTFQALRIFINKELENIETFLKTSLQFLTPKARIVCISFHSLEDRIVKNFFKTNQTILKNLTPKPIKATKEEIVKNPSSRSAKLRAAKKV